MRDKKTIRMSKLLKLLAHDSQPVTIKWRIYYFKDKEYEVREYKYTSRNNALNGHHSDLYVQSFEIGENQELIITATLCKEHAEMM